MLVDGNDDTMVTVEDMKIFVLEVVVIDNSVAMMDDGMMDDHDKGRVH